MERSNTRTICIAGKNNIAIEIADILRNQYPDINLIACCNQNDNGENNFQRSYRAYCMLNKIEIIELDDIYTIHNLIFLSLEFDKIIKTELFSTKELYNIHFSYLPMYKGMYTSAWPILNRENFSGVTLHKIDNGIDTGEIIQRRKIELTSSTTAQELYLQYIHQGTKLVSDHLDDIIFNRCKSTPQEAENASYYSKQSINYVDIKINLNKTANEIRSQIYGFTFPYYQLPKVLGQKVYKSEILRSRSFKKPGTLINETEFYFDIATIDNVLRLYKDRMNELMHIAKNGNLHSLEFYLLNQYDVHQKTKEGWDIAIVSAFNAQIDFLDFLLEKLNWNINTYNNNGTTLLMYLMTMANKQNKFKVFKDFLKRPRLDIFQNDFRGKSVLDYASNFEDKQFYNHLITIK
ncbi:MAG: hypothetical protein LC107_04410 [Chitinophagales bacterium]|nr:hypothetical protein [Chitinophagales bacterium]